jgi:hypothetical protein
MTSVVASLILFLRSSSCCRRWMVHPTFHASSQEVNQRCEVRRVKQPHIWFTLTNTMIWEVTTKKCSHISVKMRRSFILLKKSIFLQIIFMSLQSQKVLKHVLAHNVDDSPHTLLRPLVKQNHLWTSCHEDSHFTKSAHCVY